MDTIWQDVRYGLRTLSRRPGFTAVVALTLALGIGANTAIFTLADAVLFRTLPVREPERLVNLVVRYKDGFDPSFNYPLFTDYRSRNEVFTGLAAYVLTSMHLSSGQDSERIRAMLVSGDYFEVLGVRPSLGRSFLPDEGRENQAAAVAVISHNLWQNHFGGSREALSKEIVLNGRRFTIVGVVPRGFLGNQLGQEARVYIPITPYSVDYPEGVGDPLSKRTFPWIQMFGRLKPGVTREQAQERMRELTARIHEREPKATEQDLLLTDASRGYTRLVDDLGRPLALLQLIVGLVLIIACANVANLLIARATARRREMAVRLALGAGRGRIQRQLLAESAVLALLGGAAGLLVAVWLAHFLQSLRPTMEAHVALDGRALLFTLGVALLTGLFFGLAPAWQASRTVVVAGLKEGPGSGGARRVNLRGALVVAQLAMSLVVLTTAGLAVQSLRALRGIDSGLDTERVMLFAVDVGRGGYDEKLHRSGYDEARGRAFFEALLERVRAIPGVQSAALANVRPLTGGAWRRRSIPEGQTLDEKQPIELSMNAVSSEYFATMGIPLLRGRDFTARDTAQAPRVGVVNETLVRHYWPGQDAIGKRIQLGTKPRQELLVEVVGVVRDSKYRALTEPVPATLYMPITQNYEPGVDLVVRSAQPAATIDPVRGVVRELDATLPVFAVRSLAEQLDLSLSTPRMAASLLSLFAGLALLLGGIGLYGVMAWMVTQRTREIGIRMALGAARADILRMVVGQGIKLLALGAVLGFAGAFGATRVMESLLYEVHPRDPFTFAAVGAVLAVAALAACWLPARRAARMDPMVALRYE